MNLIFAILTVLISALAYWRWLRVAQREHYYAGRVFAIMSLWIRVRPVNFVFYLGLGLLSLVGLVFAPVVAMVVAAAWLSWPIGLALRGTPPLAWTDRMKRLVVITAVLHVAAGTFLLFGRALSMLPVFVLPITEIALLISAPIERALGRRWQLQAAEKLRQVSPRIVAITGSYGKTSTKNAAAHLAAGRFTVLASPASFNNAMGLSRAVNERLTPGTDVFIAEMGVFGPGEITALVKVFPPEIAAITTIGVAHLERMRNRATIARAKLEILPPARTLVLNVDVPELATAADRAEAEGKTVYRVDSLGRAVMRVRVASVETIVDVPEGQIPVNVGVAAAIALALGVEQEQVAARLSGLPVTPHRAEVTREGNLTVIDDTFNSNPVGAAAALEKGLGLLGSKNILWTLTPGMVELGHEQESLNRTFAAQATAAQNQRLVVVGHTNKRALMKGGESGRTRWFASRQQALAWLIKQVSKGDVVLHENDLPDHYA